MKKLVVVTLLAILAASNTLATGLQQFDLAVPAIFVTEEYKANLQDWRSSLLNGVGYDENIIRESVFLQTDIPMKVNGHKSTGQVYQNKDIEHQFYVRASNTIIDFDARQVGTMGVSSITIHPTPSGRMVMILAPGESINLLGVTLDFTFKVQAKPPEFTGLSESTWKAQIPIVSRVVTSPGGKWFWNIHRGEFEESYRQIIDDIVSKGPD
jgi:hypothetical protein